MYEQVFEKLNKSKFRSRFKLTQKDRDYINTKGLETIKQHAKDFVRRRIAPAEIENDGKQTPMKNHPVFVAQHATACCCRGCIKKWHGFEAGVQLTDEQQEYLVGLIMEWINKQIK